MSGLRSSRECGDHAAEPRDLGRAEGRVHGHGEGSLFAEQGIKAIRSRNERLPGIGGGDREARGAEEFDHGGVHATRNRDRDLSGSFHLVQDPMAGRRGQLAGGLQNAR